jgi:DNA-binding LacI/PurR family transcriptional regulator
VGFDDFNGRLLRPRLTLMAQPCNEIGRQAAALLNKDRLRR